MLMKISKFRFFVPLLPLLLGLITCSPNSVEPQPTESCPTVKVVDTPADSLQLDSFELKQIAINGDTLFVEVSHGGGCEQHRYALFMSPSVFAESFPVQANLYFQHNANGDHCKALLRPKVCFDLRPVAALYQKFYGRKEQIRLNVFGYSPGQAAPKFSVIYQPQ